MQSCTDHYWVHSGYATASLTHREVLQQLLSCRPEVERGDECLQESQRWFGLGHEVEHRI